MVLGENNYPKNYFYIYSIYSNGNSMGRQKIIVWNYSHGEKVNENNDEVINDVNKINMER